MQVTKEMIFDPRPFAIMIEQLLEPWLAPVAPGVYMPNNMMPLLKPGYKYYQWMLDTKTGVPYASEVTMASQIKSDVFRADTDMLAIDFRRAKQLVDFPPVFSRGIHIVYEIAKNIVYESSFTYAKVEDKTLTQSLLNRDIVSVIRHFLALDDDSIRLRNPRLAQLWEILEGPIHQIVMRLTADIGQFIGDNDWIMHFAKMQGMDIVIEKTIDYRIYDWTRKMQDKEWK